MYVLFVLYMNGTGRRTCHLLLKVRMVGRDQIANMIDVQPFLISPGELIIMAHNGLINPDIYSMTLSALRWRRYDGTSFFPILPFMRQLTE